MNKRPTKVVNIFGGPGIGKTTTAMQVFVKLSNSGISCEFAPEFAKTLVWDGVLEKPASPEHQLYIFGNQLWNVQRLMSKVDYIITDSPLLLSLVYVEEDYPQEFGNMVFWQWDRFTNLNYVLTRSYPYARNGRIHTEEEAREIDSYILYLLDELAEPYTVVEDGKGFSAADMIAASVMHLHSFPKHLTK